DRSADRGGDGDRNGLQLVAHQLCGQGPAGCCPCRFLSGESAGPASQGQQGTAEPMTFLHDAVLPSSGNDCASPGTDGRNSRSPGSSPEENVGKSAHRTKAKERERSEQPIQSALPPRSAG